MVTTVTDNSPQSINTSLFAMDGEIQKVKKIAESFDEKLSGIDIETGVLSVNGKQGIVELTASDVDALPSSTVIPTTTSELENTSGFITSSDSITGNAATATTADIATKAIQDGNGNVITSTYAKKGEVGVPQVVHFNTSQSAGSYELVRFGFRSAFRCVISGTCRNYAEAKIIDVIASSADVPQSNTLGNTAIGPQGNFSFGGGDWAGSSMYWNKPLTEENVYYTVVLIPYSESRIDLVI